MSKYIIYEQPITEHARACLRLEELFSSIKQHQHVDYKVTLSALVQILNILDRTDLKTKLTKVLNNVLANFQRYRQSAMADIERINQVSSGIQELLNELINLKGRLGQNLRDIEFLNTIYQHLNSPASSAIFDIPAYQYWLAQSEQKKQQDLNYWISGLSLTHKVTVTITQLTREHRNTQQRTASKGFYHQSLSTPNNLQLIQVEVPDGFAAFPEISVGRHGLSVRFKELQDGSRYIPSQMDIPFKLSCCDL